MDNSITIITGVGYRSSEGNHAITDIFGSKYVKANIGAWSALELAKLGQDVLMVSRSAEKLQAIKDSISHIAVRQGRVDYAAIDLLDKSAVIELVENLPNDKIVHLVHSVGLSSSAYRVKEDNPYLKVTDLPDELPVKEYEVVIKTLLYLVKYLMPRFVKQRESRIVVVSSMSSIRPFPLGFSHASAKAGLHHAVRSLALELNKKRIFVSEVMPGIVDTGMYDNSSVQSSVRTIGKAFGYDYDNVPLPQMPPSEVAKAIILCFTSEAHILNIALVAKGQWPNLGA
jgi:short-subunit dehydrogenase